MSHFAKVVDGIVEQVIVAEQDYINLLPNPEQWIQTSYNTRAGQHLHGGTPLRGNFAGVGYVYDTEHDVFYLPKPHPNAVLDKTTWHWNGLPVTEL